MTQNTFLEIVRIVQPIMEKRDTQLHEAVPTVAFVAIVQDVINWKFISYNSKAI